MSSNPDVVKREEVPEKQKKSPVKAKPQEDKDQSDEKKKKAQQAMLKRNKKFSISDYSYHLVIGGVILICIAGGVSFFMSDKKKLSITPVIIDKEIQEHNAQNYPFKIGENEFFKGWKLSNAKYIINNQLSTKSSFQRCMASEDSSLLPERYDFRQNHSECARNITNQGNCSSSYAVTPISTLADRFCFQSKEKYKPALSAQVILSCEKNRNFGCKGGYATTVLDYGKKEGFPDEECFPYSGDSEVQCPSTINGCQKYKVQDYCVVGGEENIKREIFKNGPVFVVVPIYRDFLVYKEGIYSFLGGSARFSGGHGLKIVGWDSDNNGKKYWIVENSWGESWGMNGMAHIAIGTKEFYIDDFALAPIPLLEKEEGKDEESLEGLTTEDLEEDKDEKTEKEELQEDKVDDGKNDDKKEN